jgi:hypothetical protein
MAGLGWPSRAGMATGSPKARGMRQPWLAEVKGRGGCRSRAARLRVWPCPSPSRIFDRCAAPSALLQAMAAQAPAYLDLSVNDVHLNCSPERLMQELARQTAALDDARIALYNSIETTAEHLSATGDHPVHPRTGAVRPLPRDLRPLVGTARKTIDRLRADDLVTTVRGRGTYVEP